MFADGTTDVSWRYWLDSISPVTVENLEEREGEREA